jgi:hypothetical protein
MVLRKVGLTLARAMPQGPRLRAGQASDQDESLPVNERAQPRLLMPISCNIGQITKPIRVRIRTVPQNVNKSRDMVPSICHVPDSSHSLHDIGMNESASFRQAPVSRRGRPLLDLTEDERIERGWKQRNESYRHTQLLKRDPEVTTEDANSSCGTTALLLDLNMGQAYSRGLKGTALDG